MTKEHKIYLAPLQGFTDFAFRNVYSSLLGNISTYYIPYISVGPKHQIRNSAYRDILPENNQGINIVPQILCSNSDELIFLADQLKDLNYSSVNLNLGCPYPMAVKKGRGTGLLENSDQLTAILDLLFNRYSFDVSVKFRAGINDPAVIFKQIKLLQNYPFQKFIFHPRTAKQLYKGKANLDLFRQLSEENFLPLVYNGDIETKEDFEKLSDLLPRQTEWMIGRGILKNIFLPQQIKGIPATSSSQKELLLSFHEKIVEEYKKQLNDSGHILNKTKEFWTYFSFHFSDQHKVNKLIRKIKNLNDYPHLVSEIFRNFL